MRAVLSACLLAATLAAGPAARSAPAQRAISLAPHITELIYAAGAGGHLVGTVVSSREPPAAALLPRVGDGIQVSAEQVVALTPDLVLAWQPSAATRALEPTLRRIGAELAYSRPERLDDIPAEIERYGVLFGTQAAAHEAAGALAQRIAALRQSHAGRPVVRVFIQFGMAPLRTVGADPLLNDVLSGCGGRNVYADSDLPGLQVSPESVVLRQPEVVILAHDANRLELARQYWDGLHLQAAQQGRLYALDPDQLLRPGPRLVDAMQQLCGQLEQARSADRARTP